MTWEMRVALVEDDPWKRSAMEERLTQHRNLLVEFAIDQDEAVDSGCERWSSLDAVIVDIYDDRAPGEVGTDLYSGISALDHLGDIPIKTLAIIPHNPHPLVQLRLAQAGPDWVYRRWELPDPDQIAEALRWSTNDRRPRRPTATELQPFGAVNARCNDAVRAYLASPVAGRLRPGIGHKHLSPLTRSQLDTLRRAVSAAGFTSTELRLQPDALPRWPDVRDILLRLLGRLDAPASDHDLPWPLS